MPSSAAPPNAIRVWAVNQWIYAEIPSRDKPYITKLPRGTRGLSELIHLIYGSADYSGVPYISNDKPTVKNPAVHAALAKHGAFKK